MCAADCNFRDEVALQLDRSQNGIDPGTRRERLTFLDTNRDECAQNFGSEGRRWLCLEHFVDYFKEPEVIRANGVVLNASQIMKDLSRMIIGP